MERNAVDTIWNGELTGEEPWLDEPAGGVLDAYSRLTLAEARTLATRVLEALPAAGSGLPIQREALVAMLTRVVCCQPEVLLGLHGQLLDRDIFDEVEDLMGLDPNPTILFHRADPPLVTVCFSCFRTAGNTHRRSSWRRPLLGLTTGKSAVPSRNGG